MRIFLSKNKFFFVGSIFLNFFSALFNIYVAFLLKDLIELALNYDGSQFSKFIIELILFLAGFVLIGTLKFIFENIYTERSMINFKKECFKLLLKNKRVIANGNATGKYISYFTSNMDSIQKNYVEAIISIYSNIILILLGVASMLYLNAIMTIGVIIVSLLPILGSSLLANMIGDSEKVVSDRNKGYTEYLRDVLTGFQVIKSFGAENEALKTLSAQATFLERAKLERNNKDDLAGVISNTLGNGSIILTFIIGVILSAKKIVTVGTVIAFIQLLNYVLGPVDSLSNSIANLPAGKRLIELLSKELQEQVIKTGNENLHSIEEIKLDEVEFSYAEKKVISDVSINLKRGNAYAIVGASGCGKTTLLNIISGDCIPQKGNVTFNNIDSSILDNECKSKLISSIQQNVIIFNASIRENITMWREDFSEKEIENAIKLSELNEVVREKGIDYQCGENGVNLSGGEKQRISIARAILQNSSVILFDEGTSALDKERSVLIQRAVVSLKDKIVIAVTHDLDERSLELYDEIIAIKNGKITELGPYKELMEKKGYLWALKNI